MVVKEAIWKKESKNRRKIRNKNAFFKGRIFNLLTL